jgi:hypothetical protein
MDVASPVGADSAAEVRSGTGVLLELQAVNKSIPRGIKVYFKLNMVSSSWYLVAVNL